MKKTIVKLAKKIAESSAKVSASASFPYVMYQPKMPSKLIKKD